MADVIGIKEPSTTYMTLTPKLSLTWSHTFSLSVSLSHVHIHIYVDVLTYMAQGFFCSFTGYIYVYIYLIRERHVTLS